MFIIYIKFIVLLRNKTVFFFFFKRKIMNNIQKIYVLYYVSTYIYYIKIIKRNVKYKKKSNQQIKKNMPLKPLSHYQMAEIQRTKFPHSV